MESKKASRYLLLTFMLRHAKFGCKAKARGLSPRTGELLKSTRTVFRFGLHLALNSDIGNYSEVLFSKRV